MPPIENNITPGLLLLNRLNNFLVSRSS